MLTQYYWKQRQEYVFAPQHVSIPDYVVNYKNGVYEIIYWHKGIKNQLYVDQTGYNMKSSFNNLLTQKTCITGMPTNGRISFCRFREYYTGAMG